MKENPSWWQRTKSTSLGGPIKSSIAEDSLPLVVFHHSNIELPESIEHILSKFLVTPRLHGIHHSVVRAETDSNWSSGLSIWDRFHDTFRDIYQHDGVTIGVPAFRRQVDLELIPLLEMPFVEQRPSWELPPANMTDGL